MDKISLTASMRSNLLSLQNISRQVDSTQNKLSTGKKVNSAIDNPSSYYTARSLTNRASDLDALLDSMGQAVSTIKAATEALESATDFLEQAKAVATQALESSLVKDIGETAKTYTKLDKSWFEQQVGANGAVVSTADELKTAIASGKELICVYGKIDFHNESITLADNQKLVGTEYFANINENALWRDSDGKHFSYLNFNNENGVYSKSGIFLGNNSLVSDLQIDIYDEAGENVAAVFAHYKSGTVKNLTINSLGEASSKQNVGLMSRFGTITISGKVNINVADTKMGIGIYAYAGDIKIENANISINNNSGSNWGILAGEKASIETSEKNDIEFTNCYLGTLSGNLGGNDIIIGSNDTLVFKSEKSFLNMDANIKNNITIKKGAKIYFNQSVGCPVQVELKEDYMWIGSDSYSNNLDYENIFTSLTETGKAKVIDIKYYNGISRDSERQYISIISQYDSLIKDAGYKGVNLLQEQDLKVTFNEGRTSWLDVMGKDASSTALGLTTLKWNSKVDIEKSIEELTNAMNQIRSMSSELGSYYNIVLTRQDFTENLINVLEEGADKLTLADMNEESANMLALQTRQQLAINSLSLASQAAQGILRLF